MLIDDDTKCGHLLYDCFDHERESVVHVNDCEH